MIRNGSLLRYRNTSLTRSVRVLALVTGAVVFSILGAACRQPRKDAGDRILKLSMGGATSPALALGRALASAQPSIVPGVRVQLRPSIGSVDNVAALQSGEADIGLATADVAYFASGGQMEPDRVPFDRLRGVAVITLIPVNLIVKSTSSIRSVADLRGKHIGIGEVGTSTNVTATVVLKAFGFRPGTVHADPIPVNDGAKMLDEGTLDAYFVNGYLETPDDFVRPARRVLSLVGPGVAQLRQEYPFLRPMRVPSGVYPAGAVRTVGVDWLLVCRSGLDETVVYSFTKAFFERLTVWSTAVDALRFVDLERAPATPIPLHEGAARYYREREIAR